ncbi:hypothetical protein GCM10017744_007930 [Streptomyces antimycoticus]
MEHHRAPGEISRPTYDWETRGFKVNEGPSALQRNGRLFLTYSASATDANYCMGLLTASAGSDLLAAVSWKKSPRPVFTSNDTTKQYGPATTPSPSPRTVTPTSSSTTPASTRTSPATR